MSLTRVAYSAGSAVPERTLNQTNRQHLGPVHSHLPGASLVRKENNIIEIFIDMVQKAKQDVHGLTHLGRITPFCADHAAIQESTSRSRWYSVIHARVPADFPYSSWN